MKYIIYLIVFYIFIPSSIQAADEHGEYLVMGLGNLSCEAYLHEREKGQTYFLSWLSGYMTHYNQSVENTYSVLGHKKVQDVEQWLVAFCTINKQTAFEQAVKTMLKKYHYSRHRAKLP